MTSETKQLKNELDTLVMEFRKAYFKVIFSRKKIKITDKLSMSAEIPNLFMVIKQYLNTIESAKALSGFMTALSKEVKENDKEGSLADIDLKKIKNNPTKSYNWMYYSLFKEMITGASLYAPAYQKSLKAGSIAPIRKAIIDNNLQGQLEEIKGMEHKNIALETLKKLLNDEIKGRTRINLVRSKSFMEQLEELIRKYNNKIITAAEVIEELIGLAKDIKESDKEPQELGLTDFEFAFYTAVADNKSARELMGKEKLKELAIVLYDRVKKNTTIDWTIRESARAKLKVIVKRTLRQYGYPPDMEALATETVLKQAELIVNEIVTDDINDN